MSPIVLAAQTRCHVPWSNISAQEMAMNTASLSVVQLDAIANSCLVNRLAGLEHATTSRMRTRANMRPAWNLSVTMNAGRPATEL